jgi:hypothetical protein
MSKLIPNQGDSLFRTGVKTTEQFNCVAMEEYEKRQVAQQKKLYEEINRRALQGKYNV